MHRKHRTMTRRTKILAVLAAFVAVILGGALAASAATGNRNANVGLGDDLTWHLCVDANGTVHANTNTANWATNKCAAGQHQLHFPLTSVTGGGGGGTGPAGPAGPQGPAGPAGKDGFLSWGHGDIGEPSTPLEHIGGPIRSNGTNMSTITGLDPGVYQLFINSSFTRTAAASATDSDTYPIMTAWREDAADPTWNADFSNTVITVNGGRMSRGKTIDETVNGSALVTIHATSDVIHFVAFAYDEDAGSSGAVQVDFGSYSMVQLDSNPAHGA